MGAFFCVHIWYIHARGLFFALKDGSPLHLRHLKYFLFTLLAVGPASAQQTTATFTQTVNVRGTVLELSGTPLTGLVVGSNVTFTGFLDTGGAAPVTSETVALSDGATQLTTVTIGSATTTNQLPYSQDFTQWTPYTNGAAAPTTSLTATAPDGTTNAATVLAFPATTGNAVSGLSYSLPTPNYPGQPVTVSVWVQSAANATLTMAISDSPQTTTIAPTACTAVAAWTRCSYTFAMPANAGSGVAMYLYSTNQPTTSINVWGAQLEQASAVGPYIETTGTSLSGQGGTFTWSSSDFLEGQHSVTASYAGDANYSASTSTPVVFTVGRGQAAVTLTQSTASTVYGSQVTFTATLTGPDDVPTGTVTFMDGATAIGTGTITNGVATLQISTLLAGSHQITAVYSGDTEFNSVTSAAVTHVVTQATATMGVTSSKDPSVYGDSITLTVTVTGTGAAIPTGTVTVMDGTTTLGTPTLDGTGKATLTTSLLGAGTHNLTFTYSGDANYQ